ncbi:MAG: hypothetical protein NTX56_19800 [Proteobacteria bacterium]|nr:hypothetical protein [Pseudomonadota bacterium]
MNAKVEAIAGKEKTFPVSVNQAVIAGRLGPRRTMALKEGKRFLQLCMTPAPDPYSMPSVVELKSIAPLGNEGDDWSGVVRVGGYPNNFNVTDKDGVITSVRSARVVLEAVEGS